MLTDFSDTDVERLAAQTGLPLVLSHNPDSPPGSPPAHDGGHRIKTDGGRLRVSSPLPLAGGEFRPIVTSNAISGHEQTRYDCPD